jgi:DNA-binding IclR family transcriptional regulator
VKQPNSPARQIPIKVVGKVSVILDAFRRMGPELTLGQIATTAQLETSTASRLVASMVHVGLLRYEPVQRLYSPGLIMLELSRVVLNRFSFRELSHRELIALSTATGWQCYLAVADEDDDQHLIYIDAVSTQSPELSDIGQRRLMHSTATGKVLLAFRDAPLKGIQLEPVTPRTTTDLDALKRELKQVRVNGYAISEDEAEPGISSVAAPIFDGDGRVVAAFGVGTTDADYAAQRERLIESVVTKARGISSALRLSESGSAK